VKKDVLLYKNDIILRKPTLSDSCA